MNKQDVIDQVEAVVLRFGGKPHVIIVDVTFINQEKGYITTIVRNTGDITHFLNKYSGMHYIDVERVRYCALEDFKLPKLPQKEY
jgi:hypothetical protein